tara:strand:- start:724 stop:876 length:153 start_codon:yes stop_codon:yes gene_type:complete
MEELIKNLYHKEMEYDYEYDECLIVLCEEEDLFYLLKDNKDTILEILEEL